MTTGFVQFLRRLLFVLIVIAVPTASYLIYVVVSTGSREIFHKAIHATSDKLIQTWAEMIVPLAMSFAVWLLSILVAYVLFYPMHKGLTRIFRSSPASERGKQLVNRLFGIVYWSIVLFLSSFLLINPETLLKLFVGFSLTSAVLAFALQSAAADIFWGSMLYIFPRYKRGENLHLVEYKIEGRVRAVTFMTTELETKDGLLVIPNSKMCTLPVEIKSVSASNPG